MIRAIGSKVRYASYAASSAEFQVPDQTPFAQTDLLLTEIGEKDPALKVRVADQIVSLSTRSKIRAQSRLEAHDLVASKRAKRQALQRARRQSDAKRSTAKCCRKSQRSIRNELISLRQSAPNNRRPGDMLTAMQSYGARKWRGPWINARRNQRCPSGKGQGSSAGLERARS